MTTATQPLRARWRVLLLAALAAVLALVLPAGTVSANGLSAAQTRVGVSTLAAPDVVGVAEHIAAGQHWVRGPSQLRLVSGHCVAAEGADAAAVDVGHAGIHQFPGVTAGKSQFFDGADLGGLSSTGDLAGVVQKNGNIRYVLRGSGDVGVDRTTGLPTDIYTVDSQA